MAPSLAGDPYRTSNPSLTAASDNRRSLQIIASVSALSPQADSAAGKLQRVCRTQRMDA